MGWFERYEKKGKMVIELQINCDSAYKKRKKFLFKHGLISMNMIVL